MLYALVIAIHVTACLILIVVILLQAGRGGGLSETFGGDTTRTIFGTKASVFFTKATVVAASLYLVTCLVLGIMTSRRGRSLIELERRKATPITIPQPRHEEIPLAEPEALPTE